MLLFWDNALKIHLSCQGLGVIILTIISLNLVGSQFQRPSRNVHVKACSKADLLLDNNLSVIAQMCCSDAQSQ